MNDWLVQSYPFFKPNRSPKKSPLHDEDPEDVDSDATILIDTNTGKDELDTPIIKYNVKTEMFGIRRLVIQKKVRYYRCHVCKEKIIKLALLNLHYKDLHPSSRSRGGPWGPWPPLCPG